MHWGIIESRPLLRGRVRTLSIAPEGLALLEHRYPHESGRIVDVAGLEEVASFHIGG
ncbi:MAG TPA: mycofactocin system GMC family oxidoreductase MftG, partial [Armatimonadetes bacterium]|nr:mycofactocin system GMC family oxidoreductase MftG [Armatimonadota bacterium]